MVSRGRSPNLPPPQILVSPPQIPGVPIRVPGVPTPVPGVPTPWQVLGAEHADLQGGGAGRWPQQVALHILVPRRHLLFLGGRGGGVWQRGDPREGFWGPGQGGALTWARSPARRTARLTCSKPCERPSRCRGCCRLSHLQLRLRPGTAGTPRSPGWHQRHPEARLKPSQNVRSSPKMKFHPGLKCRPKCVSPVSPQCQPRACLKPL